MANQVMGRLFLIVSILVLAGCASLPPASTCKEFQGVWEGQMLPRQHQMTIEFDDSCGYAWYGTDPIITGATGKVFLDSGGGLTFKNSTGGGGDITYTTEGQRKRLVWRPSRWGYQLGRFTIDVTKK